MSDSPKHIFERSGLACLSDLETTEWRELFSLLEKEQEAFLEKEAHFRSPEYRWPRDSLHTWSRIWEYPYVYYHLRQWRSNYELSALPQVVDVGSGVTFFPFSVARLGYYVTCTDIDPVCEKDLKRAVQVLNPCPGMVDFERTDGIVLPFDDGTADAVYCISLLEHISNYETMIYEIARILKPSGLFVVTMDLGQGPNIGLGVKEQRAIASVLDQYFEFRFPETTVHPANLLHSKTGPHPMIPSNTFWAMWFNLKQRVLKPLLGLKQIDIAHLTLFIQGAVLRRR